MSKTPDLSHLTLSAHCLQKGSSKVSSLGDNLMLLSGAKLKANKEAVADEMASGERSPNTITKSPKTLPHKSGSGLSRSTPVLEVAHDSAPSAPPSIRVERPPSPHGEQDGKTSPPKPVPKLPSVIPLLRGSEPSRDWSVESAPELSPRTRNPSRSPRTSTPSQALPPAKETPAVQPVVGAVVGVEGGEAAAPPPRPPKATNNVRDEAVKKEKQRQNM